MNLIVILWEFTDPVSLFLFVPLTCKGIYMCVCVLKYKKKIKDTIWITKHRLIKKFPILLELHSTLARSHTWCLLAYLKHLSQIRPGMIGNVLLLVCLISGISVFFIFNHVAVHTTSANVTTIKLQLFAANECRMRPNLSSRLVVVRYMQRSLQYIPIQLDWIRYWSREK